MLAYEGFFTSTVIIIADYNFLFEKALILLKSVAQTPAPSTYLYEFC